MSKKYIAVDFDGTLAEYTGWRGHDHLGAPIPRMVERIKAWIAQGLTVKIFTARVGPGQHKDPELARIIAQEAEVNLREWCHTHIGVALEITNIKDFGMLELWDDRAVRVIPNTGLRCCNVSGETP